MTTPPNFVDVTKRLNDLYETFIGGRPFYVGMQKEAFDLYHAHLSVTMLETVANRLRP